MPILFVAVLVAFIACDLENLEVTIPIKEQVINFEVGEYNAQQSTKVYQSVPAATNEMVLLDTIMEINLAEAAKEEGYDYEALKELILTNATIELNEDNPDFDMSVFDNLKLFIDDRTKPVAQADKIEGNAVAIKIIDSGNLLEKLDNDNLHIILTGNALPSERVKLKLIADFKAKIRAFKLK